MFVFFYIHIYIYLFHKLNCEHAKIMRNMDKDNMQALIHFD